MLTESYELKVHLAYDDESGRWFVAESDIPGLRLEADSPMELIARIQDAAPELMELNHDELLAACRARSAASVDKRYVPAASPRPFWKPVFDSPLRLAHA